MIIAQKDYEVYERIKSELKTRTNEIFKLLKGIEIGWNEGYEYCTIDGDLTFRVGGHYRGEYDYEEYSRPIDYLFMSDEEIIKAEDAREKDIKKSQELEEKLEKDRIRNKEIEQLKALREKYPEL